jgi:hypothetical protein
MTENAPPTIDDRHREVEAALEAARVEVVRRMRARGYPLSVQIAELQIMPNADGGGWTSDWTTVSVSGLQNFNVEIALQDESVPHTLVGLRPQLERLAQKLNETTDLGTRPANFLPAQTGIDAILARYLSRLARAYLTGLQSLEYPDPTLLARLTGELDELIAADMVQHTTQIAIEGIDVSSPLDHRGVKLRPAHAFGAGSLLAKPRQLSVEPLPATNRLCCAP